MKLLIGLGNPGEKYNNNRHNAGHMFVDFVNEQVQSSKFSRREVGIPTLRSSEKVQSLDSKFIKTDCFMNVSGKFVKQHALRFKLQDLYVVHDDLDIPLGKFKIQFGTGPKLHNGILSIEEELETNEFWRVRIGVDNPSTRVARSGQNKMNGEDFVLQDFTEEERKQLQTVFENIYKQLQA